MNNRWQKLVRSLHQKKYRFKEKLFLVEGEKNVLEALQSGWQMEALFGTADFLAKHQELVSQQACWVEETGTAVLEKNGTLVSNQAGLAVMQMATPAEPNITQGLYLALDQVRDPGNMGTIFRIADWYGVSHIFCAEGSADIYNPKTIAAAMGSLFRVSFSYTNLAEKLAALQGHLPIYGTFMQGESLHTYPCKLPALVVLGNESNGIDEKLQPYMNQALTIPRFGGAESLNVAVSTAVVCDNFMRSLAT